jgi:hypothetical protein
MGELGVPGPVRKYEAVSYWFLTGRFRDKDAHAHLLADRIAGAQDHVVINMTAIMIQYQGYA